MTEEFSPSFFLFNGQDLLLVDFYLAGRIFCPAIFSFQNRNRRKKSSVVIRGQRKISFASDTKGLEKEVQEIFPWVYLPLVLKQGLIDNMGREQETPLFSWFYFGRIQSIIGSIILSLSIGQYGI